VARCMKEGIVGGDAFAVDASIVVADAHRRRSVAKVEDLDPTLSRAVAEYLSVLDDAAFGGATPIEPKAISPTDPAAHYTASANSVAGYAYSDNYLVDLKHAVIMDVEATTAIRQAEVGAAKTMLDRTAERFDVQPSRLVADAGYGSAEMLGWLVDERGIEPHVKVFDKSERADGTFSRSDLGFDAERDLYVCPEGKPARRRQERRHDRLSGQQVRLRDLPIQIEMLPQRRRPEDRTLDLRSGPRQGPSDRKDGCLRRLTPRAEKG
jgi:Transposase DDE domain